MQPLTRDEEAYVHFAGCIDDLNNAWRALNKIKEHRGHPLVGYAFRFALVEYSKPYRTSHGTTGRFRIDERFVPSESLDLHRRILAARDQMHAHSDLTVKEASVYIANTAYGKHVGMALNNLDPLAEIQHIDAFIKLIEGTLEAMYAEVNLLEAALPVRGGAIS